jgi:membrane-bound inhibitor of C-type lysozyme
MWQAANNSKNHMIIFSNGMLVEEQIVSLSGGRYAFKQITFN